MLGNRENKLSSIGSEPVNGERLCTEQPRKPTFKMAAVEPLPSEQSTHKEFSDSFNSSSYKFGHSYSNTSINGKPAERTSSINNNNVGDTSQFTSDGKVPSSAQELRCCDFADINCATFSSQKRHALNFGIKGSEKDVIASTQDSELEESRPEECEELISPEKANEHSALASKSSLHVEESGSFTADINMDILVQNGPLSLKERISNIDMSIEWIKCELTVMRAQDLSLRQQFEQLFKDVMELKLHMEMEKDEDQFIEEEMSFEGEF